MYEDYKYKELTHQIIGCAMQVHSFLGNGFQEIIYQRALAIEFNKAGLDYARELEMEIFYKDVEEPIGKRRVDFLVENKVVVELKALINTDDSHKAQILNYLKAYKMEVGLLLNFGTKSLEYHRYALSKP